jgi:ABC-type sulfate transport system permease subunit
LFSPPIRLSANIFFPIPNVVHKLWPDLQFHNQNVFSAYYIIGAMGYQTTRILQITNTCKTRNEGAMLCTMSRGGIFLR